MARIEKDTMGEVKVPKWAVLGSADTAFYRKFSTAQDINKAAAKLSLHSHIIFEKRCIDQL